MQNRGKQRYWFSGMYKIEEIQTLTPHLDGYISSVFPLKHLRLGHVTWQRSGLCPGRCFGPAAWGSAQWSGNWRGLFERNRFWLACVTRSTAPLIECLFAKSLLVHLPPLSPVWSRPVTRVVCGGWRGVGGAGGSGQPRWPKMDTQQETANMTVSLWIKVAPSAAPDSSSLSLHRRSAHQSSFCCFLLPPSSSCSSIFLSASPPPTPTCFRQAFYSLEDVSLGVKGQCHRVSRPPSAQLDLLITQVFSFVCLFWCIHLYRWSKHYLEAYTKLSR